MKKILKTILPLLLISIVGVVYYNLTQPTKLNYFVASKIYSAPANSAFTDDIFYKCVVYSYNQENNQELPYTTNLDDNQLASISSVSCNFGTSYGCQRGPCEFSVSERLSSLDGLEKLTNLEYLSIHNHNFTELDISNNLHLKTLIASSNEISTIDLEKNTNLEVIDLSSNLLTDIDVGNQTNLKQLLIGSNLLTSIDVSKNTLLQELYLGFDYWDKGGYGVLHGEKNQISALDLSKNADLSVLNVVDNNLKELDISNNPNLKIINVSGNDLQELNVSIQKDLTNLYAFENKLTSIDVTNNEKLKVLSVASNAIQELDVSKNPLLNILSIGGWCKGYNRSYTCNGNNITELDLSNNINLDELYIDSNPIVNNLYVYKGNYLINDNVVKFSNNIDYTINSLDSVNDELTINDKNIVFNKVGVYDVSANYNHNLQTSYSKYSGILRYHVLEVTSDKYDINAEEGYIDTKNDIDEETILSNINLNYGEASIEDNKLLIKYEGELVKEFDIVNISSNKYDLTNDYIYLVNEKLDLNEINVTNATKVLEDNKLLIKHNEEVVKSFDIVNISSEKYDLSKGVVYVGPYDFDNTLINITNATLEETEDLLTVKYNDIVLQEYPIIKFYSDAYEITDKYIIKRQSLGGAYFFKSNYQLRYISRDTFPVNYLVIEYNDKEIAQLINVRYDSSVYDMFDESKNYIYVGTGNLDLNEIIVSTGINKTVENNKLIISHEGTIFKEMNILSINFGELITLDKKIVVPKETIYEDFLSNITANGVTPKIYNDKEEVTTGFITSSMNLQFYVGEELVDTYEIIDEYLEISDNLKINETTSMIEDLTVGQTVEYIKQNIDTTGTVRVVNQEYNEATNTVGTGYKLVIELSKETIEYTLVVSGDITGDGKIQMSDVMKAATQMVDQNTIVGDYYLKAADVTGDGEIKMSDVMKLANYVIEGGSL